MIMKILIIHEAMCQAKIREARITPTRKGYIMVYTRLTPQWGDYFNNYTDFRVM